MLNDFSIRLISISIMGGLATIVTILCKILFGQKLSPKAHLFIWVPVVIRFIVPYIPESNLSVYNYVPDNMPLYPATNIPSTQINIINKVFEVDLLPVVWILGMFVTITILLLSYIYFLKTLKTDDVIQEHIIDVSEKAAEMCGLKKQPELVICENSISPMIIGFIKQKILLPENIVMSFSYEQLMIIFVHEYTHLKKKDYLMNFLLFIINIVHWFNPIVWIMCRIIKRDNENVCDEKALKILSDDNQYLYGKTILDLIEYTKNPISDFVISSMASTKKTIKRRMKTIYGFGRKKLSISILPVCIVISVSLLTGPMAKEVKSTISSIAEIIEPIAVIPSPNTSIVQIPDELSKVQDADIPKKEEIRNEDSISTSTTKLTTDDAPSSDHEVTDNFIEHTDTEVQSQTNDEVTSNSDMPTLKPITQRQESEKVEKDIPEKIYTYISESTQGSAIARFSTDKAQASFSAEMDNIEIKTVGLNNSSDDKISGYFNIMMDREIIAENVKGYVDASVSDIRFHSIDGEYSYSFKLTQKIIE